MRAILSCWFVRSVASRWRLKGRQAAENVMSFTAVSAGSWRSQAWIGGSGDLAFAGRDSIGLFFQSAWHLWRAFSKGSARRARLGKVVSAARAGTSKLAWTAAVWLELWRICSRFCVFASAAPRRIDDRTLKQAWHCSCNRNRLAANLLAGSIRRGQGRRTAWSVQMLRLNAGRRRLQRGSERVAFQIEGLRSRALLLLAAHSWWGSTSRQSNHLALKALRCTQTQARQRRLASVFWAMRDAAYHTGLRRHALEKAGLLTELSNLRLESNNRERGHRELQDELQAERKGLKHLMGELEAERGNSRRLREELDVARSETSAAKQQLQAAHSMSNWREAADREAASKGLFVDLNGVTNKLERCDPQSNGSRPSSQRSLQQAAPREPVATTVVVSSVPLQREGSIRSKTPTPPSASKRRPPSSPAHSRPGRFLGPAFR